MTTALEVEHHFPRRPPPPHRPPPSTCNLHPYEAVTGFCASCLRERLSGLEASANSATAPGRRSTSALRSIFSKASGGGVPLPPFGPPSSFLRPELRRCKSFSYARSDGFSVPRASTSSSSALEPQRRSCDVRGHSNLSSLFHQNDRSRLGAPSRACFLSTATAERLTEAERRNVGFKGTAFFVPPVIEAYDDDEDNGPVDPVLVVGTSGELDVGGQQVVNAAAELKPMKDHIDVDAQRQQKPKKLPAKDLKEMAGSFLLAASVFGKKLQRWGKKQKKPKKQVSKAAAAAMPIQNVRISSRRFRDTQSEIAVDTFGRRSCDTDPRFSLDAGRMSFDDPRYSVDEPRASCDGYLIGGRSTFPRHLPMLSVVEDGPPVVPRSDGLIPVEEDAVIPGGSAQTRNYYLDSSSRRRRSLDRSSSIREQSTEITEPRSLFNAKVAPAGSTELFHFDHGSSLDQSLKNWSSNSLRDYYSGSFKSVLGDSHNGTDTKKTRRWTKAWSLWDFIQGRHGSKSRPDVIDGSFSESWPEFQVEACNRKFLRSNSTASSKGYSSVNCAYGSMRKAHVEINGHGKKTDQFVFERNPSARHSTGHDGNDTLWSYSTPMRNGRRMGNSMNGNQVSSQYFTRSLLGLY